MLREKACLHNEGGAGYYYTLSLGDKLPLHNVPTIFPQEQARHQPHEAPAKVYSM